MRRALISGICVLAAFFPARAAHAAFDDPVLLFVPSIGQSGKPPPAGYFEGPCGLAVDGSGRFYVADYYHRTVDVYNPITGSVYDGLDGYLGQLSEFDPLDGPCALALDSAGNLYVNDYHRAVIRFGAYPGFGAGTVIAGAGVDSAEPTGVAVSESSGHVFVDDRTSLAEYDSAGALVREIGVGTLGDGYGVAVSGYPTTAGYLYVPDASGNTVEVYDPSADTVNPIATIGGPPGGFGDLHDSAVAVDDATGEVYVIDTLGPQHSETPQAIVDVFDAAGAYEGRLKYNVVNGGPSGLAVDNSGGSTQGRVYVTSGITDQATVYAYPPHAASSASLPASSLLKETAAGDDAGTVSSEPPPVPAAAVTTTPVTRAPATSIRRSVEARHRHRKPHRRRHRSGHRQVGRSR